MITITKSDDWDSALAVHLMSMGGADFEQDDDMHLWIAWDGDQPVGFATLRVEGVYVYFAGCGVIPIARGQGIQKKLLKVRLTWGKRKKFRTAVSYTMAWNARSMNNLIACKFKTFQPEYKWASDDDDVVYWYKSLNPKETENKTKVI